MKSRVIEPVGDDSVTCSIPCDGKKALENTDGYKVCNIMLAPALGGANVDFRMHPDLMRKCIRLNAEEQ